MSRVCFQADWNLNQIIVEAARRRAALLDFQTAHVAGLLGLPDLQVLRRAAQANRLLVTHDFHDLPQHFATFVLDHTSAGVLLVPQRLPVASVVDDLLLIWETTTAEEWRNSILALPL